MVHTKVLTFSKTWFVLVAMYYLAARRSLQAVLWKTHVCVLCVCCNDIVPKWYHHIASIQGQYSGTEEKFYGIFAHGSL